MTTNFRTGNAMIRDHLAAHPRALRAVLLTARALRRTPDALSVKEVGQRLRGRAQRGLESNQGLLARSLAGEPKGAPRLPQSGDNPLAVHARRTRPNDGVAGWSEPRQLLFGPSRRR